MADFDFQVFEFGRELQQRLNLQQLLVLFSYDFLFCITTLQDRIKLEWGVPYVRILSRECGTLGLDSADRQERMGGDSGGSKRGIKIAHKKEERQQEVEENSVRLKMTI